MAFLAVDIDKPGEIWDERSRYAAGLSYMFNIVNADFTKESWEINFAHPPVGKYLYGLVNGANVYMQVPGLLSLSYDESLKILDDTRSVIPGRMLAITLASMSVVFTFMVAREFLGYKVGIASALVLLASPVFVANMKVGNLEAPLIFFFMSGIYVLLKALKDGGNSNYYVVFGIVAGLAVASKFNNIIIFFLLPVFYVIFNYNEILKQKLGHVRKMPVKMLLTPAIAFLVMLVLWPWMWSDPIGNLYTSLTWWTYQSPEYYLGNLQPASYEYYLLYFIATTPVVMLGIFAFGLYKSKDNGTFLKIAIAWFAVSMIIFSMTGFKQNGPRYIISLYPAFAILVGYGIVNIFDKVREKYGKFSYLVPVLLAAYMIMTLAAVHPFYITYYNEIVGGPGNVYDGKIMVVGFQGEGIHEAVEYVNSVAPEDSTIEFHSVPVHVTGNLREDVIDVNPPTDKEYLRLSEIREPDSEVHGADFVVENTNFRWYYDAGLSENLASSGYVLDKTIEVNGAELAWVYRKTS